MPRHQQDADMIRRILLAAIRDRHACVIQFRGGGPHTIQPLSLSDDVLTYQRDLDDSNGRVERHRLGLIVEAVDVRQSLDDIEEKRWGGARERSGRPLSRLVIQLPPDIATQLDTIARTEGRERYEQIVFDSVRPALLDMIERWQDEHD